MGNIFTRRRCVKSSRESFTTCMDQKPDFNKGCKTPGRISAHGSGDEEYTEERIYLKVGPLLGHGAFGKVFAARYKSESVAVKVISSTRNNKLLAERECAIYRILKDCETIPKCYGFGRMAKEEYFLMVELLGPSLDKLVNICGGTFSEKTTAFIGLQLLATLEFFHSRKIVYRDIKPDNCLIGTGKKRHLVYLTDFNLSERFDCDKTKIFLERVDRAVGTPQYKSINSHKRLEPHPNDDIESLGYMLVEFITGSLPWNILEARAAPELDSKILNMKHSMTVFELCKGCPNELLQYFLYVKRHGYTEMPDYEYLESLFNKILKGPDLKCSWRGKVKDEKYNTLSTKPLRR